jgi:hypothetical protein
MRRRKWSRPDEPVPSHPYRNSAVFHAVLACIIVVVAWATGGSLRNAIYVALAFFAVATGWSWTQWRRRLREDERARAAGATRPRPTEGKR